MSTYPKALMANIEAAKLGAVNHYEVAEQVMRIAATDVRMATRHGSHLMTRTLRGNLRISKQSQRGFYRVADFNNGETVIFEGSKAETVAFLAGLYDITKE